MAAAAPLRFLLLSVVASLQLVVLMPSAAAAAEMPALDQEDDQEDSCESILQCPLGQSLVASPALTLCNGRCTEALCCVPDEEPLAVVVVDGGKVTQRKLEAAGANGAESGSSDPNSNSTENTSTTTQTTTETLTSSTITETTTSSSSSFTSSMTQTTTTNTTTAAAAETNTTPSETPGEGMAVVYSGSMTAEVEGPCDGRILEDDSVKEALGKTIAALANVEAGYVAVSLRCSRRLSDGGLAAAGPAVSLRGRGLQSTGSSMIVSYTITIPPHASGAVTPANHQEVADALDDVSPESFNSQLEYYLADADALTINVVEIGAVTVEFQPLDGTAADDGPQYSIISGASRVSGTALAFAHVAAAALAILLSAPITL